MLTLSDAASIHCNLFFRWWWGNSCWLPFAALLWGLFPLRSCSLCALLRRSFLFMERGLRILRRQNWLVRLRVFQWFFWLIIISRTLLFFHWTFSSLWSDLFGWGLLGFYWLARRLCLGLQLDGDCFSWWFAGCALITRWQSWFLLSFFNWGGCPDSALWSYFLNWGGRNFSFWHHSLFEVALGLWKTFLSRLDPWWRFLYGALAFELASHSRLLCCLNGFGAPERVGSGSWRAWTLLCHWGSSRWLLFVSYYLLSASWRTLLLILCTSLGFGGSFGDLFLQFGLSQG